MQVMSQWEEQWRANGESGVPLLVAPDGRVLAGLASQDNIRQFMP
jgi:hypothetical protein